MCILPNQLHLLWQLHHPSLPQHSPSSFFLHLSLFCLTSVLHQYAVTVLSDMTLLNTVNLFRCHHTLLSINPFSPVQPLSVVLKSSCFILFSCSTDINFTFLCLGSQRLELCLCKNNNSNFDIYNLFYLSKIEIWNCLNQFIWS